LKDYQNIIQIDIDGVVDLDDSKQEPAVEIQSFDSDKEEGMSNGGQIFKDRMDMFSSRNQSFVG